MVKKLKEKKHLTAKGKLHEAVEKGNKVTSGERSKIPCLGRDYCRCDIYTSGRKVSVCQSIGEAITGYTIDEVLKMDFWGLTHPDYRN